MEEQKRKETRIPESDPYSDYIAANPWRMYAAGVIIMLLVSILGIFVTIAAKGGINICKSSEGFEARGIPEAEALISASHIPNEECQGKLSLRADGVCSKFYSQQFDFKDLGGKNIRFVSPSSCYDGYVPSDEGSRRSLASEDTNASSSTNASTRSTNASTRNVRWSY